MMNQKVCINLISFHKWEDSIECIESLLKLDYPDFQIFLIDNASTDSTIAQIERYLNREVLPHVPEEPTLKPLVAPIGTTKIPYEIITEAEFTKYQIINNSDVKVTIIRNTKNFGFSYANNQVLKRLAASDIDGFCWILNNDTVVTPTALIELVKALESDEKIGIAGSVMPYYHDPSILQCMGGVKFYPYLGFGKMYLKNSPVSNLKTITEDQILENTNYLPGTSILIKESFINAVGFFDDEYFMYAEDIDLFFRARAAGWKYRVVKSSIVYHKEGKSTAGKRHMFYFLYNRGNMIFMRKHFGIIELLTAIPASFLHNIKMSASPKNIWFAIKGMWAGLTQPLTVFYK